MTDTPRRVFGVLCGLIVVWIAVYWLWEPAEPPVTYGERPPSLIMAELVDELPAGTRDPLLTKQPPAAQPPAQQSPRRDPPQQTAPPGPPAPPVMVKRVVPPAFREYTVQRGDVSFDIIAGKELGDRRLGWAIAKANPLVTPDKLRPGQTVLKIPLDASNIQGRVVEEPAPQTAAPPTAPPAPAPATAEYTVAPGDTLSGISKRFYGEVGLWEIILRANRDQLREPEQLRPGMVLKIPPKPAGGR